MTRRTGGKKALRYHIKTYGCQMNEHDSEILAGLLENEGYVPTDDVSRADVVLMNTCCVRESAEQRILGELGRLKQYQDAKPDMILGVCGCMPMEKGALDKIMHRASHVNLIFGINSIHLLPELLHRARDAEETVVSVGRSPDIIPAELPRRRAEGVRAWVPIMYGCDKYCTYCIVPYVRGRERSRSPEKILADVRRLVADGVREITLLGQNVNSYGKNLKEDVDFADLLVLLDQVEGLRWIRYTTSHPNDFDTHLIQLVLDLESVTEHFHLPVQSGNDRVLTRMNRGYTVAEYAELVQYIRSRCPGAGASVTTDVIVGFPGETDEDFQDTVGLFKELRFDGAFSFMYSPRPGTPAANFDEQIPEETKRRRLQRLNQIQYPISLERNEAYVGRRVTVLVDGPTDKDPDILAGRTRTNKLVLFPGAKRYRGRFIQVDIQRAETFQLWGRMVKGDRA